MGLNNSSIRNAFIAALVMSGFAIPGFSADVTGHVLFAATPSDRLYGINIHGDSGTAVGESGLIVKSVDGGKSWAKEAAPTSLALSNVSRTGSLEVAVGQMGLVLLRQDGGDWREVESNTDLRLLNVDLNSNGLGAIVGAFGTLLRTTDGGETWESIAPHWQALYDDGSRDADAPIRDEPSNYVVKVFDDGRMIIGGEYGVLLESRDRGRTWDVLYRFPETEGGMAPTIFDMTVSGNRGYAVGQDGLLLRSDDAGYTWEVVDTPVNASLFAVALGDDEQVFAVGHRVAIASDSGGRAWKVVGSLDFSLNWYSGAAHGMSEGGKMLAVGHSGRIVAVSIFD